MLFIRSPHDIYYDIYGLVKMGFSAEYIETISPAERGIYKSYYAMENDSKNTDENAKAAEAVGLNLEDL